MAKTYEDDGHDREQQDGLALFDRLLALFDGLVGLDHAGLLLLEDDEVVDLPAVLISHP